MSLTKDKAREYLELYLDAKKKPVVLPKTDERAVTEYDTDGSTIIAKWSFLDLLKIAYNLEEKNERT